jgi:hypothetical protein
MEFVLAQGFSTFNFLVFWVPPTHDPRLIHLDSRLNTQYTNREHHDHDKLIPYTVPRKPHALCELQ